MTEFENFIAAYLGQGWEREYASWVEAVDEYAADAPDGAAAAPSDIANLLAKNDAELEGYMGQVNVFYTAPMPTREWLAAMQHRFLDRTTEGVRP